MDELHLEAPGLYHITGLVGDELDLVRQLVLLQLELNQAVGHGGAMDGAVHLPHGVGNRTDMVLVAVGDEEAPQLLLVGHQIGKVRDHQIHAVHILLGKAHTAVHHDHVLAVFQHGNVLADLVQTAKRDNFQFFSQNNTPFIVHKGFLRTKMSKMDTTSRQPNSVSSGPESPSPGKTPARYFVFPCANARYLLPVKAQPEKRQR